MFNFELLILNQVGSSLFICENEKS